MISAYGQPGSHPLQNISNVLSVCSARLTLLKISLPISVSFRHDDISIASGHNFGFPHCFVASVELPELI